MDAIENRPRILLSAYACEPNRGSEPEVGWRVALQMARGCDLTVVTRSNNRTAIEEALKEHDGPRPEFLYFDLPDPFLWLKKRLLGTSGYYVLWQVALRWRLRREIGRVDLIHHVTFNGVQFPGFWLFAAKPVVLGPLGGGMTCPPLLMPLLGEAEGSERRRTRLIHCLGFLPWWKAAIRQAGAVIAANQETAAVIQACRREQVPVMLETAVAREAIVPRTHLRVSGDKLRVLWLGHLIPRKAPFLAVLVAEEVLKADDRLELVIAGGGPEEPRLREEIERRGLGDSVVLTGRVQKTEVGSLMDTADAFLFTSVRDTSGNVVLEAMSRELPVVAVCHQGVREICDPDSALLVEPGALDETVTKLAAALLRLIREENLAGQIGVAGRRRLEGSQLWSHYGQRMMEIYRNLVSA